MRKDILKKVVYVPIAAQKYLRDNGYPLTSKGYHIYKHPIFGFTCEMRFVPPGDKRSYHFVYKD